MSDRVLGGIGLVLAAFYIWQATTIQVSFISDPVGPKTFPIIIGLLLAVSSLVIMLKPDAEPHWPAIGRLAEIALAVVVLVAYAMALPAVGFVAATAVASAFLSWRLGTAPLPAVAAGVAIALGIYVVFHLILGLSLAEGPYGF
ncbi:MAG: tripartite tricarboxylate transporter TctB family protein [Geminicoccaceae bacterium]|nr:tripartite tricarboxylate transporter TctB family protein [Geminicoccaceae bacterium]